MSFLGTVSSNVENIPGFGVVSDVYEQYAPDHFKTRDPFYTKVNGEHVRRKAPADANDRQRQAWKQVVRTAWNYDRNFCCGCVGVDIGLGIIPIVNILPVIGPIIAYTLQGSLIRKSSEGGAPASVQAKMAANCGTDFLISLCPVLGVLFSWMFGCATRNAALFDAWLAQKGAPGKRKELKRPKDVTGPTFDHGGTRAVTQAPTGKFSERSRAQTGASGQYTPTYAPTNAPTNSAYPSQHAQRAPAAPAQPTKPTPYRPPTVDL